MMRAAISQWNTMAVRVYREVVLMKNSLYPFRWTGGHWSRLGETHDKVSGHFLHARHAIPCLLPIIAAMERRGANASRNLPNIVHRDLFA
jgi:hypothetical protein